MNAGDVMTRNVVTIAPDMKVLDIARLLLARGISAVPVVETNGAVIGLVSEGDLMRRGELGTEKRRGGWSEFFTGNATLARDFVHAHGAVARDVMTSPVICVDRTASLGDIADIMERKRIRRVPVLDGDRLVGLVSRANLLRAFASAAANPAPSGSSDPEIRDALLTALAHQAWSRRSENSIVVTDGVVHLWGLVTTPEESRALELAAGAVAGVKAVQNHMVVLATEPYPLYPGIVI